MHRISLPACRQEHAYITAKGDPLHDRLILGAPSDGSLRNGLSVLPARQAIETDRKGHRDGIIAGTKWHVGFGLPPKAPGRILAPGDRHDDGGDDDDAARDRGSGRVLDAGQPYPQRAQNVLQLGDESHVGG
jgi:hypothetical protein